MWARRCWHILSAFLLVIFPGALQVSGESESFSGERRNVKEKKKQAQVDNVQFSHVVKESSNPLCTEPWVVILSAGRSGSTTITEMLHQSPCVRIRGETRAFPKAADLYSTTHSGLNTLNAREGGPSFHPKVDKRELLRSLQQFFMALNPDYHHPGAKL
jgi:hypothetical protein